MCASCNRTPSSEITPDFCTFSCIRIRNSACGHTVTAMTKSLTAAAQTTVERRFGPYEYTNMWIMLVEWCGLERFRKSRTHAERVEYISSDVDATKFKVLDSRPGHLRLKNFRCVWFQALTMVPSRVGASTGKVSSTRTANTRFNQPRRRPESVRNSNAAKNSDQGGFEMVRLAVYPFLLLVSWQRLHRCTRDVYESNLMQWVPLERIHPHARVGLRNIYSFPDGKTEKACYLKKTR